MAQYQPSDEKVSRVARAMHSKWVEETVASGVTEKYKPIPGIENMSSVEIVNLMRVTPQSRAVNNNNGKLALEQNIVQTADNINPALMDKLNGAVAKDYLLAVNGLEKQPELAAAKIHEVWIKHNEWQRGNASQLFVPYNELPENEKSKDREVASVVLENSCGKSTALHRGETPEKKSAWENFPMPTRGFV